MVEQCIRTRQNATILIKVASGDKNADIGTKRVPRVLFDKLTDTIIDKALREVNHKVNKTIM